MPPVLAHQLLHLEDGLKEPGSQPQTSSLLSRDRSAGPPRLQYPEPRERDLQHEGPRDEGLDAGASP